MIRVTKQTDVGVLLLTQIAQHGVAQADGVRPLTARELSERLGSGLPNVSKILKILCKGGLLISHRGQKGGYELARPASTITVAEMLAALDGPIALTECVDGGCDLESWCPTRSSWRLINQAVFHALEGLTLERMAQPCCGVLTATSVRPATSESNAEASPPKTATDPRTPAHEVRANLQI